jgi:hypothetical protein
MKFAMSFFQRSFFGSNVDKTSSNTCHLWLIPFLNGDRDGVPNNHSALIYKFCHVLFFGSNGLPFGAITSMLNL